MTDYHQNNVIRVILACIPILNPIQKQIKDTNVFSMLISSKARLSNG